MSLKRTWMCSRVAGALGGQGPWGTLLGFSNRILQVPTGVTSACVAGEAGRGHAGESVWLLPAALSLILLMIATKSKLPSPGVSFVWFRSTWFADSSAPVDVHDQPPKVCSPEAPAMLLAGFFYVIEPCPRGKKAFAHVALNSPDEINPGYVYRKHDKGLRHGRRLSWYPGDTCSRLSRHLSECRDV